MVVVAMSSTMALRAGAQEEDQAAELANPTFSLIRVPITNQRDIPSSQARLRVPSSRDVAGHVRPKSN